jgi:hypothetical protein
MKEVVPSTADTTARNTLKVRPTWYQSVSLSQPFSVSTPLTHTSDQNSLQILDYSRRTNTSSFGLLLRPTCERRPRPSSVSAFTSVFPLSHSAVAEACDAFAALVEEPWRGSREMFL